MSLIDLRNVNVVLGLMVIMLLLGAFVGYQLGYRQAYTYVNGWHEEYKSRWCVCTEPVPYDPMEGYIQDLVRPLNHTITIEEG